MVRPTDVARVETVRRHEHGPASPFGKVGADGGQLQRGALPKNLYEPEASELLDLVAKRRI
jgi:hypothetical protein